MTETKFTPGPWACRPSAFVADGNDKRTYFIVSGLGFSGKADANAHLIAAAPELYDALQNLLSRLANDADGCAWFLDEQEASIIALAKARGEA